MVFTHLIRDVQNQLLQKNIRKMDIQSLNQPGGLSTKNFNKMLEGIIDFKYLFTAVFF